MTNKQTTRSSRSDSTTSGSSYGTVRATDNQETDDTSIEIEPRMKLYIDSAIQAATISLMQQMQQFITQHEWNAQILETINQKLVHIEQPNSSYNSQPIPMSNHNNRKIINRE
ncbi:hypothetical protein F8M41_023431 [Gigaspora margarita]|uniref:Uncharacterized protein n=1 Tax=Gigaspora margarita TaxID=4874 RepID=A0A8H4EH08_GIGMA|nr:hypothetical protein F8M41_023431 [Gigaspora margarita]